MAKKLQWCCGDGAISSRCRGHYRREIRRNLSSRSLVMGPFPFQPTLLWRLMCTGTTGSHKCVITLLSLCGKSLNPWEKFSWQLCDNYMRLVRCITVIHHELKRQTLLKRRRFVTSCSCGSQLWAWKFSSAAKSINLRRCMGKSAHKCLSQAINHIIRWNVFADRATCDREQCAGQVLGLVCWS